MRCTRKINDVRRDLSVARAVYADVKSRARVGPSGASCCAAVERLDRGVDRGSGNREYPGRFRGWRGGEIAAFALIGHRVSCSPAFWALILEAEERFNHRLGIPPLTARNMFESAHSECVNREIIREISRFAGRNRKIGQGAPPDLEAAHEKGPKSS